MKLRRGAAKWGVAFLILAVVFSLAYIQFYQSAEAQGGPPGGNSANFDFYGYVKGPNSSFLGGANVTIEVVNFSLMTNGPPPTVAKFSNTTLLNGFFNISNITGGANYNIKIKKYKGNFTGPNTTAVYIGPTLPPFPAFFLSNDTQGILNSTFILQRAGNINLSAYNASLANRVNFTFELADTKLGFPIEDPVFDESQYIYEKIVHVPYNRNYTVQFHPHWSPPIELAINNLSLYNESPNCLNNDNCVYFINASVNTSMSMVNVWGWVNTTEFGTFNDTSANLTNLTITNYMVYLAGTW
ncbi:MAG: hypothetical protein ISS93_02280 [Candidatus Aenigmarchaeota archaeon]|nr:hypothetical protein [Candidatus Aenigmarchaeota archaeon]